MTSDTPIDPSANVAPCRHMESLLHRAADGKLRGFAKWYAWAHARRCGGCLAFLRRLEATTLALRMARASHGDDEQVEQLRQQVRSMVRESTDTEPSS